MEEKKKAKEVSYTYWVTKTQSTGLKEEYKPKKIDDKEAETISSMCRQLSKGSSWNSAGTWCAI